WGVWGTPWATVFSCEENCFFRVQVPAGWEVRTVSPPRRAPARIWCVVTLSLRPARQSRAAQRVRVTMQDAPAGSMPEPEPLRAAHTPNFPALLRGLGVSLAVTTYQAGKLVLVRDEGDHLNTHFRAFRAPMGLALDGNQLA